MAPATTERNDFNRSIIEEFRANAGKVGGPFEGAPLLLLHTTGARSGQERVNPVMYRGDGDRLAVFASKGGAPTNPDWYHNLLAHPRARVEVGTDAFDVTARVAEGEERERIWKKAAAVWPDYDNYAKRAPHRQIPVMVLEPRA